MSRHPTIDDVLTKRDPAPNWRWVVRMPTSFILTNGSSSNPFSDEQKHFAAGGAYGGFLSRSALPFIVCESVDFQTSSIDSDARFGGGIRVNYPRFESMSQVNLQLMEDDEYTAIKYLKAWRRAVKDENGNYGVPANYKRDIKLYAFDIKSNDKPSFVGTFKDCWPGSVTGMSYSFSQSGHIVLGAEFNCDKDSIEEA